MENSNSEREIRAAIPASQTEQPASASERLTKRNETTRAEHLQWCKQRALEYVAMGDLQDAYASMASDLGKHPETERHSGIVLGMAMLMGGMLSTRDDMRRFIEGFN